MFTTFRWHGWCWTGSSAWTWWYLRVRKIFVYDAREIIRQSGIVMIRCKKVIRSSIFELAPLIMDIYNCSLRVGYVPDLLKRSIINPLPKVSPPQEIQWLETLYIKHEEECFIRYLNTEKWLKKRGAAEFFLTNFKVFGYRTKHPLECLI